MLKKILLVDDEKETLSQLASILKRESYEVVSTSEGKQAVPLAMSAKPDLIILDMVLPDMLGAEISHELSKNPSLSSIPIIFLTGLNTKEDEEIIKEKAGNYRLLAKPITREELLEAIRNVIP
jgi:two-component system OmpR family response regulator